MEDPRQGRESQVLRHGHAPLPLAGVWTALGSFVSPARRVKEVEYAADRVLSRGSSEGSIPDGSTSGSKLISRQLPALSPPPRPLVTAPTSTPPPFLSHAVVTS